MIDKEAFKKQLECLGSNPDWDTDKFETLEEWRERTKDFKVKNPMKDSKLIIIHKDGTREEWL